MDALKRIQEHINRIKKSGHGEVVALIKNGVIYRIKATEDELVENIKK